MPNNGRITLCPYYKNESGLTVSCEDVIRRFRWPAQKKKHMDTYCDDAWSECPYAAELTRLYEEGDDLVEHEVSALKKELKKTATMLGKANRRDEAKEATIKELRRKNKVLEDRLMEAKRKETQGKKAEEKAFNQICELTQIYEARFAYLMSEFTGGVLNEADVESWAKGKEFAIVAKARNDKGEVSLWEVKVRDEHEPGRSESGNAKAGPGEDGSASTKEKQGY